MNERDSLDSEINKPLESQSSIVESIMPGFNTVLKINHAVRRLIFDYSLIAAILGLFRFNNNEVGDILNFLILLLLNLAMIIHISHYWRTFKDRKVITITNLIFSFLGSFIIAVLVRGLFSVVSLFIPIIIILNASVGHALLTWLFGRATNQLYLSAKKIDSQTLSEILKDQKIHSLLTKENEI